MEEGTPIKKLLDDEWSFKFRKGIYEMIMIVNNGNSEECRKLGPEGTMSGKDP